MVVNIYFSKCSFIMQPNVWQNLRLILEIRTFLAANISYMHDLFFFFFVNALKIDKIQFFFTTNSWKLNFPHGYFLNARFFFRFFLSFTFINTFFSTKISKYTTNCQNIIFFRGWYFLNVLFSSVNTLLFR